MCWRSWATRVSVGDSSTWRAKGSWKPSLCAPTWASSRALAWAEARPSQTTLSYVEREFIDTWAPPSAETGLTMRRLCSVMLLHAGGSAASLCDGCRNIVLLWTPLDGSAQRGGDHYVQSPSLSNHKHISAQWSVSFVLFFFFGLSLWHWF